MNRKHLHLGIGAVTGYGWGSQPPAPRTDAAANLPRLSSPAMDRTTTRRYGSRGSPTRAIPPTGQPSSRGRCGRGTRGDRRRAGPRVDARPPSRPGARRGARGGRRLARLLSRGTRATAPCGVHRSDAVDSDVHAHAGIRISRPRDERVVDVFVGQHRTGHGQDVVGRGNGRRRGGGRERPVAHAGERRPLRPTAGRGGRRRAACRCAVRSRRAAAASRPARRRSHSCCPGGAATPYATLLGGALSHDAFHITSIEPEPDACRRMCRRRARGRRRGTATSALPQRTRTGTQQCDDGRGDGCWTNC